MSPEVLYWLGWSAPERAVSWRKPTGSSWTGHPLGEGAGAEAGEPATTVVFEIPAFEIPAFEIPAFELPAFEVPAVA
jgi:hypothetical protein